MTSLIVSLDSRIARIRSPRRGISLGKKKNIYIYILSILIFFELIFNFSHRQPATHEAYMGTRVALTPYVGSTPARKSYRASAIPYIKKKYGEKWWVTLPDQVCPGYALRSFLRERSTINSHGSWSRPGTARRGAGGGGMEGSVGFKYGKMKGLKISPVLRGGTDRSYIIPLRETRLPYPSAAYPTLLRVPPPRPSSSRLRRPFALASISPGLRFAQHAILQATHPPRGGSYVRATPVGLRGCLEMWRLRDSRENSVKRL